MQIESGEYVLASWAQRTRLEWAKLSLPDNSVIEILNIILMEND